MKHKIMGVPKGEDFPSFEKQIPIATTELRLIMGWENDEDLLHDYRLTGQQILGIEKACAMELPKHLDLFLTSHD
ncbi:MAG: pyocin S6 family toxin immunity protein [Pseudomonas fluorescens]